MVSLLKRNIDEDLFAEEQDKKIRGAKWNISL